MNEINYYYNNNKNISTLKYILYVLTSHPFMFRYKVIYNVLTLINNINNYDNNDINYNNDKISSYNDIYSAIKGNMTKYKE
jgi:hypothetical protein